MTSWLARALWALTLGLGVMAGLVRGAGPQPAPLVPVPSGVIVPPTGLLYVPPSPHPSGYSPAFAPLAELPPNQPPVPTPNAFQRNNVWSRPPCGCWMHHNLWGCGTFASEWRFVLGSCRAFFGSCCLKEMPALSVTPCPKPYAPGPYGNYRREGTYAPGRAECSCNQ